MNRNRSIQALVLVIALAALVGSSLIVPTINEQRQDLMDNEPVQGMAPKYVIFTAALGAFRGIAADMLWYRAEMLKREGQFYDAKALRDWIVTLQPRFPEVWRYQAWDMAYNISVQTGTQEERWDWVNKAIRLLRDEGIPNNPTAVPLYRELSWIFFHKIGQFTDDMHWYYKVRLAEEWQQTLGAPTEGATTAQAIAQFRPISEMAGSYFLLDSVPLATQEQLASLAERYPDAAAQLDTLTDISGTRFVVRAKRLSDRFRGNNSELAAALEGMIDTVNARLARGTRDPLSLFLEENPGVSPLLEQFRGIGLQLDAASLRRVGWWLMLAQYSDLARIMEQADHLVEQGSLQPLDRDLLRFVVAHRGSPELDKFLAYFRAGVLVQHYHMDPAVMYALMEKFGPIDWRHPAAHALYWAYLGVQKSDNLKNRARVDILNTDRSVIQSLQALFHFGRVSYDPTTEQIDMLPDPRFVESYPEAMRAAIGREVEATGSTETYVAENFEFGYENFLIKAVLYSWLYGDERKAHEMYAQLRETYAPRTHNVVSGRYTLPLEAFVAKELGQDWNSPNTIRPFIESLLTQSFRQGLKLGRMDVFNRYVRLARTMHDRYQQDRSVANPLAARERMVLLPFDQLVVETYAAYMRTPVWNIAEKGQVYRNTPLELAQRSYRRWIEAVSQHAVAEGIEPSLLFPAPEGLTDTSPAVPLAPETRRGIDAPSIERK